MDGSPRFERRDVLCIALVILLGLAVKGWLFVRMEVLARDGVGYIRFAARLDHEPWPVVLRSEQQHPLYPITVNLTHRLLRGAGLVSDAAVDWQSAAQAASLICGLLLVVPMFLLARFFFDSRVAFWAALTFQVLPVPAQITCDTLSESLFLLTSATALLAAVAGLERRNSRAFLAAGLCGGLAYLTRPEAAVVLVLAGLLVLTLQLRPAWRMPWPKALACWGGLTAAVIVALPYWLTIGGLSNKPSSLEFFKPIQESLTWHQPDRDGNSCLLASRFTDGVDGRRFGQVGPLYALYEVLDEISKAFNYCVWLPLVLGLPWYGRRLVRSPGLLLVALMILTQLLILWLVAYRVRYVSERHTLLLVLCGCILSMATLFHWVESLPRWWQAGPLARWFAGLNRVMEPIRLRKAMEAAFVLAIAAGLTQTLKIPHQHRVGHKLAGLWLQQNMQPGDKLIDPYGWASFYAGQFLPRAEDEPSAQPAPTRRRFVVVDPADQDLHRRRTIDDELARIAPAKVVFAWPEEHDPHLLVHVGSRRRQARP